MKKYVITILVLFTFSFAETETMYADITGDGVHDVIKIDSNSVLIIDRMLCCTRKKYASISDIVSLTEVLIDDYCHSIDGKEVAVVKLKDEKYITEVYGVKNHERVQVSDVLPGKIMFDDDRNLFGYHTHTWEGGAINVPYPITEQDGVLRELVLKEEIKAMLEIEANASRKVKIDLSKNTHAIIVATTLDKNVEVSLQDENGLLITQSQIDSETPLIRKSYAEEDKLIMLVIDNVDSNTPKKIYCVIKHYANSP